MLSLRGWGMVHFSSAFESFGKHKRDGYLCARGYGHEQNGRTFSDQENRRLGDHFLFALYFSQLKQTATAWKGKVAVCFNYVVPTYSVSISSIVRPEYLLYRQLHSPWPSCFVLFRHSFSPCFPIVPSSPYSIG